MNYLDIAKEVFKTQIEGLENTISVLNGEFDEAVESILKSPGRLIVTGMGKSGIIGKKISATLASTGTRSFFMHSGEAYHGDLGMLHKDDVILAISNSGETEEVIRLINFFQENGNTLISITGKAESTLAKFSDYTLCYGNPKEACPLKLAPTTTTTCTLLLGDALAVALMRARGFQSENFAKFHPGGSLGRKLLCKVKDVMISENLPILKEDSTFEEVISVISSGRLGLGVVIADNQIAGVITDGDIRRAIQQGKEKTVSMKADSFMTKNPIVVDHNLKIAEAEKIFQEKKVTAVIAVDETKKLKGILHIYDF